MVKFILPLCSVVIGVLLLFVGRVDAALSFGAAYWVMMHVNIVNAENKRKP